MEDKTIKYLQSISRTHQNELGQFFTPFKVAEFMSKWTLQSDYDEIYDPAFGLGAFYHSVESLPNFKMYGTEIDSNVHGYWIKHLSGGKTNVQVELGDYFAKWEKRYGNIVCNPPYARFQKFEDRQEIFRKLETLLGKKISGYTNIASAFLIKSIFQLRKGGRLAYIMPLEFLNTGYGTVIKDFLTRNGHLYAIIKLDCEKDIFPDVTTTCGIILFDTSTKYSEVRFYSIKDVSNLARFEQVSDYVEKKVVELKASNKWIPYFATDRVRPKVADMVKINQFGRFSRGIATGANEFFVLSEADVNRFGLKEHVVFCLSKSSQVVKSFFSNADLEVLRRTGAKVYLFSPSSSSPEEVRSYILKGENLQFHKRYLTQHRVPWYKTENRSPAPILFSVFSRGGYKVVRNTSGVLNLTCFHGFYPNLFGEDHVDSLFLYMASSAGRRVLSDSKRLYGGSLDKYEPNDLNEALCPSGEILYSMSKKSISMAMNNFRHNGYVPQEIEDLFGNLVDHLALEDSLVAD